MYKKKVLIIGAGPAGLTAAYELATRTGIEPIVFEQSTMLGGLSRTVNYKGNRIDIGGHRFFSKSDRVMAWWKKILPLQFGEDQIACSMHSKDFRPHDVTKLRSCICINNPDKTARVMLIRERLSRIFFLRNFFNYPVSLSLQTVRNLGIVRMFKILGSYIKARIFQIKPEKSLQDFFINRFGFELYATFFRDYSKKVWGVGCEQIKPEWGAQRIKGLSISKTIIHAIKQLLPKKKTIAQKGTETSLIESFMYPKLGPGQMWETVADLLCKQGHLVLMEQKVTNLLVENNLVHSITVQDKEGKETVYTADYVISTMPVKELIAAIQGPVPESVKEVAKGLVYRDFMTVGLLLKKLAVKDARNKVSTMVPDNWIYIQESDVRVGRLQIFNNWSPYLVAQVDQVWIGLEYFCNEGDDLWTMDDGALKEFAIDELVKLSMIAKEDVIDATVIRSPKAYPAYFGTYDRFDEITNYTNSIKNLYLIGRNGMHKYNNQDHSMLAAMTLVDNLLENSESKENIWQVNTEKEYHELKQQKQV